MAWLQVTGTGKTVTLSSNRKIKEGIPVFLADIKGRFIWLSQSGNGHQNWKNATSFWDHRSFWAPSLFDCGCLFSWSSCSCDCRRDGVIASFSSAWFEWNQSEFSIVFKVAPRERLALIDLKDLQSLLKEVYEHSSIIRPNMAISSNNLSSHPKKSLVLEEEGADQFSRARTWFKWSATRCIWSVISIFFRLQSSFIHQNCTQPFLIWMLSRLFETLQRLRSWKAKIGLLLWWSVLLFKDASKLFLEKVEQVVRLIRSKV